MNLFQQISDWLPGKEGWCVEPKAHALAAAVLTLRPEVVVEIGVWGGMSLIPMALAVREVGRGIVIGIDPWKKEASVENQPKENAEWWSKVDHGLIYQEFIKQLATLGLLLIVDVKKMKSDEVEVPDKIDLLHIDGNHSDQAVKDVNRFASAIRVGGMCFVDDINWEGGGVIRAVKRLQEMGFIKLYDMDKGAMFQRVK